MKRAIIPVAVMTLMAASAECQTMPPANTISGFRVTINGFTCNRETWDDALERDGKRDEVFLLCKTFIMKNTSGKPEVVGTHTVRSLVMGDVNNRAPEERRAQAGTADLRAGGIKTGDNVPSNTPWVRTARISKNCLPLLVYEGLLSSASNGYIQVMPTIWEWDGNEDFLNKMMTALNKPIIDIVNLAAGNDPIRRMVATRGNEYANLASVLLMQREGPGNNVYVERNVFGDPKDRPIGMQLNPVLNQFFYNPVGLSLNYEQASRLAESDMGYGKGVFGMQFRDHDELKGDYTVYIQVEKIPIDGQPIMQPPYVPDAIAPNKLYTISNRNASYQNKLVQQNSQAELQLLAPRNAREEYWRIRKTGDGFYIFTNEASGLNLDIKPSVAPILLPQNGKNSQQWKLVLQADGSFAIANREQGGHFIRVVEPGSRVFQSNSPFLLGNAPMLVDEYIWRFTEVR